MSFWIKYFKDAGIPAGDAANYAVVFSDNRISRAMLMDLNKEYLNDMGISILGDVISILKHAKTVFNQDARERALRDTSVIGSGTPERRPSPILKRSTPASRTIAHHIGPERSASPSVTPSPKISKSLSARLGNPVPAPVETSAVVLRLGKSQKEEVPVPKKRRVFPEHEGPYKIKMPQGTTAKTQKILEQQRKKAELQRIRVEEEKKHGSFQLKNSVFARLGSEKPKAAAPVPSTAQPTITITGLGNVNISSSTQSSVFARLGGKSTIKRAATSTVSLGDDDLEDDDLDDGNTSLEYAGVLKSSSSKKAKVESVQKVKLATKITPKATKQAAAPKTDGVLANRLKQDEKTIKSRLGPKLEEVSSTTSQSKPLSARGSAAKQGVQNRLGAKSSTGDFTITVDTTTSNMANSGVFNRLGKAKS